MEQEFLIDNSLAKYSPNSSVSPSNRRLSTNEFTGRGTIIDRAVKKLSIMNKKAKEISVQQFKFIYKNKIQLHLNDKKHLHFEELNVLFTAYEYYRYEANSKKTLDAIQQTPTLGHR